MVRGEGHLDVRRVGVPQLERAVRHPHNIRVGATNDPLSRAHSYEQHGVSGRFFVGTFLYANARNARQAEQHLLNVARQFGRGALNTQWRSNYQDIPGYVYVVIARPAAGRRAQPARRAPGLRRLPSRSGDNCCIM